MQEKEVDLSSSFVSLPGATPAPSHFHPRFGLNSQTKAQGDLITLSQSDKWLRQAKVIDEWNVTTTDTAIAFRKISRGSTRLSYPGWLVFLRELAETKRLPLPQVWARLEQVCLLWCCMMPNAQCVH